MRFEASGQAVLSAGPTLPQATQHLVEGAFDTPRVTLQVAPPSGRTAVRLDAAAHVASSNPPDSEIRYQIEHSVDQGRTWQPVVADWRIVRLGHEPADFWSQSLCYGDVALPAGSTGPVQVRFRNNGGKRYLRAEAHLVYGVPDDACRVTFAWSNQSQSRRTAERTFAAGERADWEIAETGAGAKMQLGRVRARSIQRRRTELNPHPFRYFDASPAGCRPASICAMCITAIGFCCRRKSPSRCIRQDISPAVTT